MLKPRWSFAIDGEHLKTSDELLKFDYCRRMLEDRLKELGNDATQRFSPVVQWMRQVVAEKAPELLTDPQSKINESSK